MIPPEERLGHDDPLVRVATSQARLEGLVEGNFKTLFVTQRDQTKKLDDLVTRVTRLEGRRRTRPAPKRMTWKNGGAIAVAVVTVLGGLSAAYHEGLNLLTAIDHALRSGK